MKSEWLTQVKQQLRPPAQLPGAVVGVGRCFKRELTHDDGKPRPSRGKQLVRAVLAVLDKVNRR